MGLNNSKTRKKGPTPPTQRLYPNVAEEFSTYSRPHTVEFQAPPAYSQEACFGNTIPTWSWQSYHYKPSAPPEKVPAVGQSLEKQEVSAAKTTEKNCDNDNKVSDKKPCPNAKDGCILHFDFEEMKEHMKVCYFTDIRCPLNGAVENCTWQDKVKHIPTHFKDNHKENIGQVNRVTTLISPRTIHLVLLKPYKFLVHIKLDEAMKKLLIAVQCYNTQCYASKWIYEFLFEFKGQTVTKQRINGTCITAATPIEETFNKLQCRVLTMTTSEMQVFKSGGLKYKYHIMLKANSRSNVKPKLNADKKTAGNLKS